MKEYQFKDLHLGMEESFEVLVTQEMMEAFGAISGDKNPLHTDVKYARNGGYQGKVVYGLLTASFLSALAGMYMPGKHCLLQEVNVKFLLPVYVGEKLNVTGKIAEMDELFQQVVLKVQITRENNEKVLRGKIRLLVRVIE